MRRQKAYFFSLPGQGWSETYPTILEQYIAHGFERVKLRVCSAIFLRLAQNPGRAKEILAEIYPDLPPVDPRDIILPWLDHEEETLGFTIRRGHYHLAEFIRTHTDPRFMGKHLSCSCHPGVEFPFFLSAFPTYTLEALNGQGPAVQQADVGVELPRISCDEQGGLRGGGGSLRHTSGG